MKYVNHLAGFLLSMALLLALLLAIGLRADLFKEQLLKNAPLTAATASAFAEDTMAYLSGEQEEWNAGRILEGTGYEPSEDFAAHMAEVRGMAAGGKIAAIVAGALGAALLVLCCVLRRFSAALFGSGLFMPVLLCLLIALWCAVDFEGFWTLLHRLFIPGGIFSASEKIMALFPLALFKGYAFRILPAYLGSVTAAAFLTAIIAHNVRKHRRSRAAG